jgi:hypothetical protein
MCEYEGPMRQLEGVMGANQILLLKTEFEHFTSVEMNKVIKPKSYQ